MLSEIKGQDNAIEFLRKVNCGKLTTPLLLVGIEGVGKRFSVLEAAKEAWSKGDVESPHCYQIDKGVHPDLITVYPQEGKEIGVEAIREMLQSINQFPAYAPVRYVIVDGVDNMTVASANALLKTLEEPPSSTRFFLLAESSERVLPTIISRCGLLRYSRLEEAYIVQALSKFEADPLKALVYSRLAEGSLGRAIRFWGSARLSLRDQIWGLLKVWLRGDLSSMFLAVDDLEKNKQLILGLRFLEHLLHDFIMYPYNPSRITNVDIAEAVAQLRVEIGEARLDLLLQGLRTVLALPSKVLLAFHVKSFLASAVIE